MRTSGSIAILGSACAVNAVLVGAAYLSMPPLFERIATGEGWSLAALQRSWALVPLGSGLVALATGSVISRYADRSMTAVAGALAMAGLLGQAASTGAVQFGAASFAFGLGSGSLLVILTSRVTRTFEGPHAGVAQAAFFGAYTLGTAVGLVTAETLADALDGWRRVPSVWAALSLFVLITAVRVSFPPSGTPTPTTGVTGTRTRLAVYGTVYATYIGAYLGIAGLLPYQLREWGWEGTAADGVLALSTLGFLGGSFALGALTDRFGHRRATFAICMIVAGGLTLSIPSIATGSGSHVAVGLVVTGIGLSCGNLALFFPIVMNDPATGGDRAPRSVGITTAASYFGGFLVPFALAPFSQQHPEAVLTGYGVVFALSGLVMWSTSANGAQSSD